jgi:hypothetical protein
MQRIVELLHILLVSAELLAYNFYEIEGYLKCHNLVEVSIQKSNALSWMSNKMFHPSEGQSMKHPNISGKN